MISVLPRQMKPASRNFTTMQSFSQNIVPNLLGRKMDVYEHSKAGVTVVSVLTTNVLFTCCMCMLKAYEMFNLLSL